MVNLNNSVILCHSSANSKTGRLPLLAASENKKYNTKKLEYNLFYLSENVSPENDSRFPRWFSIFSFICLVNKTN